MNKRGKAWHLIVLAVLIVAFSLTAIFGVSSTYGDTRTTYVKGASDIRFGIDIRGGVDVTCTAVLIMQPARDPSAAALTTYSPQGIVKNAVLSKTITPLTRN